MKKFFSTILCGLLFCLNNTYAYDSYQSFRARPLSVNLDFQYFNTTANFNAEGQRDALPSGYSYTMMNFSPHVRWQLSSDFAVLGGLNVASSESKDFGFSRKNSLLNKVDVAAEYLFINDVWMRWFARLSYTQPLEKIDYAGDMVLTSSGASEIAPEIIINLDFQDGVYTFLKGGLNVRGNGLSMLGTYGAGAEFRFSDFGIGLSLLGAMTVKDDEYTQRASYRDNLNNRVNAGSKTFNSINPNIHTLEANFNFLMSAQSLFKLFVGYNVLGSNISTGYYAGGNLNWVFGGATKKSPATKLPPKHKEPDVLFKEKTDDGVNQDYFKQTKPTAVPPSATLPPDPPEDRPAPGAPKNGLTNQTDSQEYIKKIDTPRPLDERPRRVFIDTTPAQHGKISAEAKKIKIKLRKKTTKVKSP